MAESHRPVSRYKQNIVADPTQLVQNINGKRPDYAERQRQMDVYEQYARPKSRRSSISSSHAADVIERPKTSRSRRRFSDANQNWSPTPTPTPRQETERPRTRHGHRQPGPSQSHPDNYAASHSQGQEPYERPVTRHGNHGNEGMERPRTRHGRNSVAEGMPMQRPYSRAGRDSVYHERPQTRHGRHSPPPQQQDMYERPVTRHGRRTPPPESVPIEQNSGAEADILILDSTASSSAPAPAPSPTPPRPQPKLRPKSAKGRSRPRPMPRPSAELADDRQTTNMISPAPSSIMMSSPTPGPPPDMISPQPPPHQPQVVSPMTRPESRPLSSSLNRYTPLPSIGRKTSADGDPHGYPMPSPRPPPQASPRAAIPRSVGERSHRRGEPQQQQQQYQYQQHEYQHHYQQEQFQQEQYQQSHQQESQQQQQQPESFTNLRSQLQRLKTQENLLAIDKDAEDDDSLVEGENNNNTKPVPQPRSKIQATLIKKENVDPSSQNPPAAIIPSGAMESEDSEPEFLPLKRKVVLPQEPLPNEEHLILAVKLPSGQRAQRRFRPLDQLQTILNFAELSAQLDFTGCELVCDVPRHLVFPDLSLVLAESGITDRTVLHVQIPDDEST